MNEMTPSQSTPNKKEHTLTAVDRERIAVSGVVEMLSFDETNVRLATACGVINLEGEGLRVHILNTREGLVTVTGKLVGVLYEETVSSSSSPPPRQRSRRFFGV